MSTRFSLSVTNTAPATRAAGAPKFAVHSHASNAVEVLSYNKLANSIAWRDVLDDEEEEEEECWRNGLLVAGRVTLAVDGEGATR
jgi:mRNA deadenylase 3'-5' endonuclease subunit Ccr4